MTALSSRLTSALLLAQVACIGVPIPGARRKPGVGETVPTNTRGSDPLNSPALAPKPVVGKQPPHLLFARDGTECTVSQKKLERTVIGASVWCVWNEAGR